MNRRDVLKLNTSNWPIQYLSPISFIKPGGDDALMDRVESVEILGNEDSLASDRLLTLEACRGTAGVIL